MRAVKTSGLSWSEAGSVTFGESVVVSVERFLALLHFSHDFDAVDHGGET
jgi:hypothetical protein